MTRSRTAIQLLGAGLVILLAVACLGRTAHAGEACPPSALTYWFMFHGGDTPVLAAAFDTTIVNSDGDTARVGFDRVARTLSLNAVGRVWAGGRVRERFDVVGVPLGTPVTAEVDFTIESDVLNNCGGGGCGAHFAATLVTGVDSVVVNGGINGPCDSCTRHVGTTLSLPVTITAGAPVEAEFALLYHTTNVAWGTISAKGSYGVSGLPPGVRAIACSGSDATPARRTTWGEIKSRYR